MVESQRAKDQLEKMLYSLTDELRAVRNKVESQQAEFNTVITDLRLRSRRLEEENKIQVGWSLSLMSVQLLHTVPWVVSAALPLVWPDLFKCGTTDWKICVCVYVCVFSTYSYSKNPDVRSRLWLFLNAYSETLSVNSFIYVLLHINVLFTKVHCVR